jgi:PPOX class probable F420-dependent enzyme
MGAVDPLEALARLESAPIGRFGTVRPDGLPHLVPITFALVEGCAVHMIDNKPKTTQRLQRLENVEGRPVASLLVDHYEEDWSKLWWVRIDGGVKVETEGDRWRSARLALKLKYRQYRNSPPTGPAIFLFIERVTHWESS